MATYNKFQPWVEYLVEGVNCGTDQFVVALSNTLPVNTNATLSQITEISYTNLSSRNLTTASSSQSGGTFSLDFNDLVLTASGAVPTFRYVVIYDDTVTGDPLVAWFDYGAGGVTMANGDTFTLTFNASGLFTVT
jgi:hypothetical protein